MVNLSFLQNGGIKSVRKNTVIKNVAYLTQVIGGQLVTIKLSPPRNLKVTNKKRKAKP
jgi:hypothetical protein